MTEYQRRYGWAIVLGALLLSIAGGVVAYNAGVSHGLAQSAATAGGAAPVPYPYPYAYGWHRPWGVGFGFPLFFLLFWVLLLRGFWWRGVSHRRWHSGGPPWFDEGGAGAGRFDEWHRRAHNRMKETAPEDDPGRGR